MRGDIITAETSPRNWGPLKTKVSLGLFVYIGEIVLAP